MTLFRLMVLATLAPALAGCAVADLAAHAVKEYDKSREPRTAEAQPQQQQPAAYQQPAYQPAATRAEEDPPTTLSAPAAPARERIGVETLK